MADYVAFLRGINVGGRGAVTMADLKAAFEDAGFKDVRTIASSGNVAFSAAKAPDERLARKAEVALKKRLARDIPTHVRSLDEIRAMIKADPYKDAMLPKDAKCVITFLDAEPVAPLKLPYRSEGATILKSRGGVAYSFYLRHPKGAVFMSVLEKTFGKKITTRTWDMIKRLVK